MAWEHHQMSTLIIQTAFCMICKGVFKMSQRALSLAQLINLLKLSVGSQKDISSLNYVKHVSLLISCLNNLFINIKRYLLDIESKLIFPLIRLCVVFMTVYYCQMKLNERT